MRYAEAVVWLENKNHRPGCQCHKCVQAHAILRVRVDNEIRAAAGKDQGSRQNGQAASRRKRRST